MKYQGGYSRSISMFEGRKTADDQIAFGKSMGRHVYNYSQEVELLEVLSIPKSLSTNTVPFTNANMLDYCSSNRNN
jgi:hypothetical protein